jgi:hypothetical protein
VLDALAVELIGLEAWAVVPSKDRGRGKVEEATLSSINTSLTATVAAQSQAISTGMAFIRKRSSRYEPSITTKSRWMECLPESASTLRDIRPTCFASASLHGDTSGAFHSMKSACVPKMSAQLPKIIE